MVENGIPTLQDRKQLQGNPKDSCISRDRAICNMSKISKPCTAEHYDATTTLCWTTKSVSLYDCWHYCYKLRMLPDLPRVTDVNLFMTRNLERIPKL
jgi:hypothetical protein